jgi:hypothetical protein
LSPIEDDETVDSNIKPEHMRDKFLLLLSICIFIFSCNQSRRQETPKNETPKALQQKSPLTEIKMSRTNSEDLLESLYQEEVENTPGLKSLENLISALPKEHSDSTKSFSSFDEKNKAFYFSANSHMQQIKDSALRKEMKEMIQTSVSAYQDQTAKQNGLINLIEAKASSLEDLHQVLKITWTLPLIKEYQLHQIPAHGPLENILQQYEEAIQATDSQIKK